MKKHSKKEAGSREDHNHGNMAVKVAGIAALAAAAAGAYFLYGSDEAPANRRKLKSWMLRLKAEVMDQMETMKDVSEETYNATVTEIAKKYAGMKDIDQEELAALIKRLKSHWKDIKKEIGKAA